MPPTDDADAAAPAPAVAPASVPPTGDADDEEDDGVRLNEAVIKSSAVLKLERTLTYQQMANMNVKVRTAKGKQKQFSDDRSVIRSAAAAARQAYSDAAKAQPKTPDVAEYLQVIYSGNLLRYFTQVLHSGTFLRY